MVANWSKWTARMDIVLFFKVYIPLLTMNSAHVSGGPKPFTESGLYGASDSAVETGPSAAALAMVTPQFQTLQA